MSVDKNTILPDHFREDMQERLIDNHMYTLHDKKTNDLDFDKRLTMLATNQIDYLSIVAKSGTILIRPSGTFMLLRGTDVIEECFGYYFPTDTYGEIVICENSNKAEYDWVEYLNRNYPGKTIKTINFFYQRTDEEIRNIFSRAELVTFSTTFSNYDWFKKLNSNIHSHNRIIGYCHDEEKWGYALEINSNIQVIKKIK